MANSTMDRFCGSDFWDIDITWNTEDPDLTKCFEKTVMVWVPCAFLWAFSSLEVFYIMHSTKRDIPWNILNVSKLLVNLILVGLSAADLGIGFSLDDNGHYVMHNVDLYTPLIKILTFCLSAVLLFYNRKHGVRTSGLQFLFWGLCGIFGAPQLRTEVRESNIQQPDPYYFYISYIVYYALVLLMFFLNWFADAEPKYSEYQKPAKPCPEEASGFLSRLLFSWFDPLAWKGFRKPLETTDLWDMKMEDSAKVVVPLFDKHWQQTVKKCESSSYNTRASFKNDSARVDFVDSSKKNKKLASILPALVKSFGPMFLFGALLKLTQDVLTFVSPQILKLLISFVKHKEEIWKGYFLAILLFATAMVQTLILSQYFNRMFIVGMRVRTALVSAIYRKALRMSNAARKESTVGEIVNLMSVDAQKFVELTAYLNMIWSAPLQIILALYFLWEVLGPSVLAGLAVMIILIPINGYIANKVKVLQIRQMKNKDERVKLMNEILSGIKVLKLYAWEPSFEAQVLKIRNKEMKVLKEAAYLNAGTSFIWSCAPFLVSMVSFIVFVFISPDNVLTPELAFVSLSLFNILAQSLTVMPMLIVHIIEVSMLSFIVFAYSSPHNILTPEVAFVSLSLFGILKMPLSLLPLLIVYIVEVSLVSFATYVLVDEKNVLDAETAFVSLSLFNILRFPLSMLPMMISNMVQAGVSVQRINKFMNCEELDSESVTHDTSESAPLVIENGNFHWGEGPTLKNINVRFSSGSLTAVVGTVGSGKSSLISAFLGEMEKTSGRINTIGSIAYVSQQAWIQNATLENNILFGKEKNVKLYDSIIEACALKPDFDMLPAGDQTEIGEKGINLSGGQKQRISLARAVYANSDTYFLDDPLSAVDSHVGKHIFEKVIGPHGLLKHKTRVLVTHGITYLPQTDKIVVLTSGEISETGTYQELLSKKGAFAEFLIQHISEAAEEVDDDGLDELKNQLSGTNVAEELTRKLQRGRSRVSESVSETGSDRANGSLQRQKSTDSASVERSLRHRSSSATEDPKVLVGEKLIEAEKTETGSVKWIVYKHYLLSIGLGLTAITLLLNMIFQGFSIGSNMWLSVWSSDPEMSKNGTVNTAKRDLYLGVYGALGIGQASAVLAFQFVHAKGTNDASGILHKYLLHCVLRLPMSFFHVTPSGRVLSKFSSDFYTIDVRLPNNIRQIIPSAAAASFLTDLSPQLGCWYAARALHVSMLVNIMRSPMSFFDTTPLGRILSRFSHDVDECDTELPFLVADGVYCFFEVVATLFVISYTTPIFVAVIVPIGVLYYFIQRFYVATSRQLKRLESVSRSPIYSHFGESVTGAVAIRAFGEQDRFIRESEAKVDFNQVCYYPSIISNRWLAVRLEMVGNLIILFSALFAVISNQNPGLVGLSVSYALQITQTLNWLVRMTSDVETNIVAVERIKEYGETPQEAAWEIPNKAPSSSWPELGTVEFKDYAVRYREGLDLVLKRVNFTVRGGEKVGIVGRTGAGKSSLTLALFRIIEAAEGEIQIDGLNIAQLGLHALRSRLTIIPQDAVLFSGSLRMNLDPFDKHSDNEVWTALEHAHLKNFVKGLSAGLNHEVAEGGENLSVGQRQLICLSRALLRKTKVLVLDEATAAVDLETDDLIQRTIRTEFKDCTVLTIAHRLNTIMDSDRVIVLDKGQIVEFDSPQNLLLNKNSIFHGMCKDAGLA